MPDTYTVEYEDTDGKVYEVPVGVNTPKDIVPHVIQGYVKTVKARMKNADILKAQAAKYPTSQEQGGAAGSITQPSNIFSPDANTPSNIINGLGRAIQNVLGAPGAAIASAGNPLPGMAATMEQFGKAALAKSNATPGPPGSPNPLPVAPSAMPSYANLSASLRNATGVDSETVGHAAAGVVPGVGPWAANVGERIGGGDIAGGIAEAAGTLALPAALNKTLQPGSATTDTIKGLSQNLREGIPIRDAIQNRMISSMVTPDKTAFDFGADPVEAAKQLKPSASVPALRRQVAENIKSAQDEIQSHIADRTAVAEQSGADTGIDVKPFIESAASRAIADAQKAGNTSLARQILRSKNALIDSWTKQYGGTYLEPNEIIHEKQALSDATRFTPDTAGQNMNTARMNLYKGMDGALNRMFGGDSVTGVESPVKEANRTVASNIELDRLLEAKELRNAKAPMTGSGGLVQSVRAQMPEVLPKTTINRFLGGGKGRVAGKSASAYEFFPRPQPGPYESGYQPQGTVSPETIGSALERGGGVDPYKSGYQQQGAISGGSGGGVPEGLPYRPGESGKISGPRSVPNTRPGKPVSSYDDLFDRLTRRK